MKTQNVFSRIEIPASQFLPSPLDDSPETEVEVKKLFDLTGIKSVEDNIRLQFSLGSVIFDLINVGMQMKIIPSPVSPKLQYLANLDLAKLATQADQEGEIEIQSKWIEHIDRILSDDEVFCKMAVFGEVIEEEPGDTKKAIPLQAKVINSLPEVKEGLLKALTL